MTSSRQSGSQLAWRPSQSGLRHLIFDETRAEAFIAARLTKEPHSNENSQPALPGTAQARNAATSRLDADFRCVADLRPLIEGGKEGTLFGREGKLSEEEAAVFRWPNPVGPYSNLGNNLFVFRKPHHFFLELAVEVATANIENRIADGPAGVWLTAGPGVFTSIYFLYQLGSLDAFLEYSAGTVLEPSASLFCEVAGSHARLTSAFAGVTIRPRGKEAGFWVRPVRRPRPSEREEPNWRLVRGSIFR